MPSLDDNIEDLDPSTDPNLDETAAPASDAAKPDDAKSSDATGEKPDDLLSVVRDVVTESRGKSETASPAEGEEVSEETAGQAKKPDDENYSDVPFSAHPRFKQLIRERNALRGDAERYHNVSSFLDQNGLSPDEAADGLMIMAKAKTVPAGAWQQIKPWVQKLLVAAGEVLPDDLRQRVQNGEITQEVALEFSRTRATAQSVSAAQSFREQLAHRQQTSAQVNALMGAAQQWENDRRLKDPNFEAKYEDVRKEVIYLRETEGSPNTPEGVRAQLQKAYKLVNDRSKAAQPAPPRRPVIRPVTGGQVAGGQRPEYASMLDIVRANRRTG